MEHAPLETFPLLSGKRKAAQRAFRKGVFRKVEYTPTGPLGHCYWNVDAAVRERGGRAIYGWQILQWPRLYILGLHHAVWESPEGTLIDLTRKMETDNRPYTTFVPDDSIVIDLDKPIFVPNLYHALMQDERIHNLIAVEKRQLEHTRKTISAIIDAGGVWQAGKGVAAPPEITAKFSDQLAVMERYKDMVTIAHQGCAEITHP